MCLEGPCRKILPFIPHRICSVFFRLFDVFFIIYRDINQHYGLSCTQMVCLLICLYKYVYIHFEFYFSRISLLLLLIKFIKHNNAHVHILDDVHLILMHFQNSHFIPWLEQVFLFISWFFLFVELTDCPRISIN